MKRIIRKLLLNWQEQKERGLGENGRKSVLSIKGIHKPLAGGSDERRL